MDKIKLIRAHSDISLGPVSSSVGNTLPKPESKAIEVSMEFHDKGVKVKAVRHKTFAAPEARSTVIIPWTNIQSILLEEEQPEAPAPKEE